MTFIPKFDFTTDTIIFLIFAFVVLLQLFYSFFFHLKFALFKENESSSSIDLPPVSIIIAARNESDNLFENLPFVLEQEYPNFEVIVINNQSNDDSFYLLKAYQQQYKHLHIIEVERNPHILPGKKLPITLGVKGAKYEHLLLTDADCKPSSQHWLKSMASRFTTEKQLVLGYGPYTKKKGFLNKLIRFDTAWIAINYFSFALKKLPYMGVGRNIAYSKELFDSVKGFKSHYHIPSGDDDLFVQQVATKRNCVINIDKQSFCYSEPPTSWSSWIRQKTRHYKTSGHYKVIKKNLLGIYPLSLLILYISFVILMFNSDFRWITLGLFTLIFILKWWIQAKCFQKINENSFAFYLPFWDLIYMIVIPILYFSMEKTQRKTW